MATPNKDALRKYLQGFKYLFKLQWQSARWLTIFQLTTSILQGVSQIGSSFFNALILAQFALLVTGQTETKTIITAVIARVVYQFVINGIYSVDSYLQVRVSNLMRLSLEERVITHMHSLSQEQLESSEYNPIITRIREELWRTSLMPREFSSYIGEVFGFAAAIISLVAIEPLIGLLVFIASGPLILLEVRAAKWQREIYTRTEIDHRIRGTMRWYMSEHEYVPEIKLLNGLGSMLKVYRFHHRKIETEEEALEKRNLKLKTLNEFSQLVVLLVGDIWLIFKAVKQVAPLDSILFARNLIQNAVNSSGTIARSSRDISEGVVFLGDLQTFFEFTPTIKDGSKKLSQNDPLEIEFKDVSFTYPGTDVEILKSVSFKITHDEKVALVGLNGAGKSTIIKLLLREYLPTKGEILVNGTSLADYRYSSYIKSVSVLMQNFLSVNAMTIRQNVSLGNDNLSDEKIYDALKIVDIDKFVAGLEKGLDERLHSSFDDGTQLSGGQLQRLFIARTLLRKSDLLVLDEPTSAIDARTEQSIFNELFNKDKKQSTLIISHRFSTVRKANKILVLDKGQIVQSGTHEELIEHKGLYHELFTKQAEGYK